MKHRIVLWGLAGVLVAAGWGVYFARASKGIPIDSILALIACLTCPIASLGSHFAIGLNRALVANLATYALIGVIVETFRLRSNPSR